VSTLFFLLIAVWIALTQSIDVIDLSVGVAGSAGIAFLQRHLFPSIHIPSILELIGRAHLLLLFLLIVLWRFISSTVYTCRLILLKLLMQNAAILAIRPACTPRRSLRALALTP
jgi:multisubunit Na+/H+ antiporter MnhE subunit